jgi:AcrR family transcriptional regulator
LTAVERRPGRPRSEAADTAIRTAVIDLLDEQGYAGLTFEAVAARAGVAKSTVYRRWPNKDELVFDAINQLKGPLPQVPAGGTVRADLLTLMQHMRRMWVNSQHGRIMRRLIGESTVRADGPCLYTSFRERLVAPRQAAIRAVLQRGIDEGSIRPDVDLAWVIGLISAPVVLAVLTNQPGATAAQVEFTIDLVLDGLRPDPSG